VSFDSNRFVMVQEPSHSRDAYGRRWLPLIIKPVTLTMSSVSRGPVSDYL